MAPRSFIGMDLNIRAHAQLSSPVPTMTKEGLSCLLQPVSSLVLWIPSLPASQSTWLSICYPFSLLCLWLLPVYRSLPIKTYSSLSHLKAKAPFPNRLPASFGLFLSFTEFERAAYTRCLHFPLLTSLTCSSTSTLISAHSIPLK